MVARSVVVDEIHGNIGGGKLPDDGDWEPVESASVKPLKFVFKLALVWAVATCSTTGPGTSTSIMEALEQRLKTLEDNSAELIQEARQQWARAERLDKEARDAQDRTISGCREASRGEV